MSNGYGFASFSAFEPSDEAIANMHGQYLANNFHLARFVRLLGTGASGANGWIYRIGLSATKSLHIVEVEDWSVWACRICLLSLTNRLDHRLVH